MSLLTVDRAYTNLLTQLQRSNSLPLPTILAAVPHYLSQLPLPHPSQLTAFVISSPLWQPLSTDSVSSLTTAFRSAVHLKQSNLKNRGGSWFSRSPEALLDEWASAVLKGVSRGDAQLRLIILGGILLGLEDLRIDELREGIQTREKVERQTVIACAEVLEAILTLDDAWKNEPTVAEPAGNEATSETVFLYSASQILPVITSGKLTALDLATLLQLGQKGIQATFLSGGFLSQLPPSSTWEPGTQITISASLADSLQAISGHPLYNAAGSLTKLISRCLSLLADALPHVAWHAFHDLSQSMESMASKVERDWKRSLLAGVIFEKEQDIEARTKELSTGIWRILKTLLFSCLLISQTILSSIPYIDSPSQTTPEPSSSSISRSVLRCLNHLSFVLSQFGGVTSSAEGFKEIKRVFYMALDILDADLDPRTNNIFVEELISGVRDLKMEPEHPFRQSKAAYVLAVVEQLVPTLSESIIEHDVVPFCHPYLDDVKHRETYESAHSVLLSIFAAHARQGEGEGQLSTEAAKPTFAERLVPFYIDLLVQNSSEGRLSTPQLRLAYSNLVRCPTSCENDALAWLCIEALLSCIEDSTSTPSSRRPMHLYLTLISIIPCISLTLLPQGLAEVQKIIEKIDGEDRVELAKAILEEITNRVGDRERELALSWWCKVSHTLALEAQEEPE